MATVSRSSSVAARKTRVAISLRLATSSLRIGKPGGIVLVMNEFARFAEAVAEASQRADVRDAIARVYDDLQHEIERVKPVCVMSGRCCRFEEFGHRLYVTTIETAAF